MKSERKFGGHCPSIKFFFILVLVSMSAAFLKAQAAEARQERARVRISTPLPELDGHHLKAILVEVNYGPGEASPPHSHPCEVVGYVVEGAIRMRVEGTPEKVYSAGDSFYEAPNGIHAVSANASGTRPAKLVAYFVCDHETQLSVDVPPAKGK